MRILVQKFGGSSVADLECMKKVRSKVLAAHEEGYKVEEGGVAGRLGGHAKLHQTILVWLIGFTLIQHAHVTVRIGESAVICTEQGKMVSNACGDLHSNGILADDEGTILTAVGGVIGNLQCNRLHTGHNGDLRVDTQHIFGQDVEDFPL